MTERTNFEIFSDSGGTLRLKEYFKCRVPRAKHGSLKFEIGRLTNVTSGHWVMALRIEFENEGLQVSELVDEDEIEPLCAAARECVRQRAELGEALADYLEFRFSTKSGFEIGLCYERKGVGMRGAFGNRRDFLKIGGRSVFLMDFAELVACLEEVQSRFDELRVIFEGASEALKEGPTDALPLLKD